jgi:protein-tyrosine phosphatase
MTDRFDILFVCMGNICRSPTAHGVFRQRVRDAGLAEQVQVASAATHDLHTGEAPDPRSVAHAGKRGYDLSDLRASALTPERLARADLVLVMDEANFAEVLARCRADQRDKVVPLTRFCSRHAATAVPDPYYGDTADFERVLDLVEDASDGLLEFFRSGRRAAS